MTSGTVYSKLIPIVDGLGASLTSEDGNISAVLVYYSGALISSDTETVTMNPATGEFTIGMSGNLTSAQVELSYNFKDTIGYARGLDWSVTTSLDGANVIGDRNAVDIRAGASEITGSIDEFFVDRVLFEQASDLIDNKLIPFKMEVRDNPDAEKPMLITFTNVRFGSWDYDMTEDGFTGNTCDFTAENVNISQ
jgi:hypothetical protein